jgi:hypothetical protein
MTKSLIIAAFAALSLTAGAAMAQDGPSGPAQDYQATKTFQWTSRQSQPHANIVGNYGSFLFHAVPVQSNGNAAMVGSDH